MKVKSLLSVLALTSGTAAKIVHVDCSSTGEGNGALDSPYISLEDVNSLNFTAGDELRLKAGTTCVGMLAPKGNGDKSSPITIGNYGSGPLPVINATGATESAVLLLNQDHWVIANLSLTNPASETGRRSGIYVNATDNSTHAGITIYGLEIDDVAGATNKRLEAEDYKASSCILVEGTTGTTRYDDVQIHDNVMSNCGGGGIKVRIGQMDNHGERLHVWNNHIEKVGGDGIVVSYGKNPLIDHNIAGDLGLGKYPWTGGNFAGIWVLGCHNAVMRHNAVYGSIMSEIDSEAFDCDWGNTGYCLVEYNYSQDNAGGIFLNCDGCGTSGGATQIVRYNIFQNDCRMYSNGDEPTLWFYNNVIYCPGKDFEIHVPPKTNFINNVFVGTVNSTLPVGAQVQYLTNVFQNVDSPIPDGLFGDPGFVDPGTGANSTEGLQGYKLKDGSVALGAGTLVKDNGGQDFWGTELIASAQPNIGADGASHTSA